jgi:hypothetical protein
MQKVVDGISAVNDLLDKKEGWKVVNQWLERRHLKNEDSAFRPEDCPVFLLEKGEKE